MSINVNKNNQNKLLLNDSILCESSENTLGLYALSDKLLFNGKIISEISSNINQLGLYMHNENLLINGNIIQQGYVEDDSEYWNPPIQEDSKYKPWSYNELISNYDTLMAKSPNYMSKHRYEDDKGNPILTSSGYELYSYVLEPPKYTKTIFVQVGIHGNEMDAKQQMLKIVDILINKTSENGYKRFADIRNNVRLVIIPCVNPYGHEHSYMNAPYKYNGEVVETGINLNRNYDYNHQYAIPQAGVGGDAPFDMVETRHVRDVIQKIGEKNIDYAMDWHDGGEVKQHYWINYAVDAPNRTLVVNFINHLINKYNIENPIIDYCKDNTTSGMASMYFAKSLGITGSVVEWIGGIQGYDFKSDQMTKSLEIRGNMLLLAYKNDIKAWRINEKKNSQYFHFDFPKAFTRRNMRLDGTENRSIVTDAMIYERWDNLQSKYPSLIIKSEKLGTDATKTQDIYTYTFGNGSNKVLYIGGIMRYGAPHKIDEYAIYQLIEYLCNDYIVNQSKSLQELRNNYTIIVLPCIDNKAGNANIINSCGLNNMALSFMKWQIIDNKCQPTTYALSVHDVPIVKTLIDNNQDLKCIVSGGEDCSKYSLNTQDYSTEFETQLVIPKNQVSSNELISYKAHLETDRNEDVVIENTKGTTFGDYAFDNYNIPTYYVQLQVCKRYTELADYHTLSKDQYLHCNYEAGRRMANIANLFLM